MRMIWTKNNNADRIEDIYTWQLVLTGIIWKKTIKTEDSTDIGGTIKCIIIM